MSVHRTLLRPVLSTRTAPLALRFASTSSEQPLTWPQYLGLRHRRRIVSTVASIPTTIAAFMGGAAYFGSLEIDPSQTLFGVDPMLVYGGAT